MPFLAMFSALAGPKVSMGIIVALIALVTVGAPAGAVWMYMRGARGEAVKAEKTACELRIAEGARLSAETMSSLIDRIRKDETPEPATDAEEAALCAKSKLCRKVAK